MTARALFATESTGRHESFYLLKVVNPGSFAISPANVQPMYQPGIQATSDLLHLQVEHGGERRQNDACTAGAVSKLKGRLFWLQWAGQFPAHAAGCRLAADSRLA